MTYAAVSKTWTDFDSLKCEKTRLQTFSGWPLDWPSPKDLAKAGLFYLKKGDRTQCAFCRGVLGTWKMSDVPLEEHKKYFPLCPFVQGFPVGNVFDENMYPDEILKYRGFPKHPDYAALDARVATYTQTWTMKQSPLQMAQAGFFYVGLSDHVRCFYCGGGLRNWEPHDDPWKEHEFWFSKCPYVKKSTSRKRKFDSANVHTIRKEKNVDPRVLSLQLDVSFNRVHREPLRIKVSTLVYVSHLVLAISLCIIFFSCF